LRQVTATKRGVQIMPKPKRPATASKRSKPKTKSLQSPDKAPKGRQAGKGNAQIRNTTRTATEDPAHVGRGLTDFNRTAVFTMKGHASSAARRAQGKRDNQQAGRTPRLPKHRDG